MAYLLKTEIRDPEAASFDFPAQATMYGGKHVAAGDTVYLFASENSGGPGLVARGVVTRAETVPRVPGVARQTPLVNVAIRRLAPSKRPLGRRDLKPFAAWGDGQPQTELNFKFYRQATDKLAGVTDATASFLDGFF